jgi:hypothetical protein
MQAPPQFTLPAGQHLPDMQAPPEQSALLQQRELSMQALPQSLKPGLHWKPHIPFMHVEVALATAGQAVQLPPHEFTLVFDAHNPEQSWVPMGHAPMQEAPLSMQTFAHSFWPMGHVAPQLVPSQVAVPP